jgi:uncharacterized protein YjbI with pentapeptide repeats
MKPIDLTEVARRLQRHQSWVARDPTAGAENRFALADAEIVGWELHLGNLCEAELVRCLIREARFTECDFTYSVLIDSAFRHSSFRSCQLRKADMRSARLEGTDFSGSDLSRCDFTESNLRGANLRGCSLNGAWLVQTDMRDTVLDGVTFVGTRFIGTKLNGASGRDVGSFEGALLDNVDLSPDANGTELLGQEALERLRRV